MLYQEFGPPSPILGERHALHAQLHGAEIAGRPPKDQGRGTGELPRQLFGDDLALSACPNVVAGSSTIRLRLVTLKS